MANLREELDKEECSCHCGCEHDSQENKCRCGEDCGCGEGCTCGDDCHCHEGDRCNENCTCEHESNCEDKCECEECHCDEECECHSKEKEYLNLARQIQADFDNYRRHAVEDKNKARLIGQISVIEAFLPCLDTFKEAKKSINDENVLIGVEMIENKILNALESLGVEKMETVGQKFDHNKHEAIAQYRDESQENDVILEEYQAGYIFNDKVIRYAKVIVNKKED
ncbi:MAG: nucleotide exchange factor GrpE [Clostridia bacterium]|nr:nucleotide exchange factor GrpE [Clostridia bacterium]MBQ8792115.1 nucleotide exchange factor GrpE [Clostridia bacterium]